MGGTPISHRQELRKQRIVREADGSVACCPERSEKLTRLEFPSRKCYTETPGCKRVNGRKRRKSVKKQTSLPAEIIKGRKMIYELAKK